MPVFWEKAATSQSCVLVDVAVTYLILCQIEIKYLKLLQAFYPERVDLPNLT
jgi:hypothetical protein